MPSNKNNLLKTKFYLSNQRTVVIRKLFDLLMLMSEFGGFVKLVVIFGYLLANPINRFIYIIIMAKRLYFAKTKRDDVFQRENDTKSANVTHRLSRYTKQDRIPQSLRMTGFHEDIKYHREIRISLLDKIFLFIHTNSRCIRRYSCWKKKNLLTALYKQAQSKILKDLNVYHIVKRLNQLENILYH